MPRKERPLDAGDSAVLAFARELRALRERSGKPTYRELSALTHYSEAALSQAAAGRRLPTLQVTLAYVRACGGNEDEWERRWQQTASADEPARDAPGSPYVGLAAFQPEDADRFFGRDRLVDELVDRVEDQRVVVVVGASGSGKSSLLRAGLMPRLTHAVVFTPGTRPLEEYARHAGQGAVLVVDQFEEIFTLCDDRDTRRRFVEQVTSHQVVLGVRADFYGHCTDFPVLVEAMGAGQVTVGPMCTDELRAAIIQPARRIGYAVETALVAELVANGVDQAGALPLLSHALLETWHRRKGNTLTLRGFRAAGGFEGALTRTAESVFGELTAPQQELARSLFIRLTAVGDGTEDTKRRMSKDELDDEPGTAHVLEAFTTHRLITVDRDRVEITHEALIRCWPRLREWLAADRDGLRAHRDLAESASVWESLGRDPGALVRGVRLASFRSWLDQPPQPLSARERDFLATSLTTESTELARARQGRRRLGVLTALLSVLLVATTAVTIVAVRAGSEATRQRNAAISQKVAQDVQRLRTGNPAAAAQLALAAFRLSPTTEARSALLSSFTPSYSTTLSGHTDNVNAVAYNASRHLLASSSRDRTIKLADVADPHHPRELSTLAGHTDNVPHLAFNSDGSVLATAGWDRTARLWDTTTGTVLATLTGHTDYVNAVAFSKDDRLLATAGTDRVVRLWDLTDLRRPHEIAALPHDQPVITLAFSGTSLVTGTSDGAALVWNLTGEPRSRALTGHAGAILAVAVSEDGQLVATAGQDRVIRVSPVGGGEPRVLAGHTDVVRGLAFGPDGRLASASVDRGARIWDLRHPGDPLVLNGHTASVVGVTFVGNQLATAGDDHTVRLWDLSGGVFVGHSDSVYAVAASGRLIASGSYDRTVRLLEDGTLVAVLTGPQDAVNSVAFSPDRRTLYAASADDRVHRWDIGDPRDPKPLPPLAGHTDAVNAMAVSQDGRMIATGSTDRAIRVWDLATGTRTAELSGHTDTVHAVAFSPDGRTLASASADHDVRVWRLADRTPLAVLSGHAERVYGLAFLDGRTLLSAGGDRTVRVWEADEQHAAERVCATVSPPLDRQTWDRHFPEVDHEPVCPG